MKLPSVRKLLQSSTAAPVEVVPSTPGGLYLGWGSAGPVHAGPEHHVLVLGPPRSGKTSALIAPALMSHQGAAVVTSTKTDVIELTRYSRERLGPLWTWSPGGTTSTVPGAEELRWSPVVGCERWDEAVARAHALATAARPERGTNEVHWVERAQALIAPLFHAAALGDHDLATVLSWLHRRDLDAPLAVLEDKGANRAADIVAGFANTDGRELSGIFSTADSVLGAYRTDAALDAARSPNFDADAFVASRGTIYLCAPSTAQALHAPLVVALLDQIRAAVYRAQPYPPVLFALDEVAQIAPLPDLASTVAEGGSQGLVVMACLQDLSQARARWGTAAEGFLTLFTHKVALPGIADLQTLEAISALAGETDVQVRSVTKSHWLATNPTSSVTLSVRRQARLPVDQVANFPEGRGLLVSGAQLNWVALPPVRA